MFFQRETHYGGKSGLWFVVGKLDPESPPVDALAEGDSDDGCSHQDELSKLFAREFR